MEPTRRAGAYLRLSQDRDEDGEGVGRQEKDCRAVAERLGWDVVDVYTDDDLSAFKRRTVTLPDGTRAKRVVRPEFRRLLADLASGAIDALIGYDLDRIARDPRDLEDLIDVVEQNHIPTRAFTGSLDLSTDSGVTMARVMVAVANKSSRDSSRRIARKHIDLAEKGQYGGGGARPYGYGRDGMTVIEEEAAVIRDIAARILDGQTVNSIAKHLTEAGVPTVRGNTHPDGTPKPWHFRSVHSAVIKARVAGLREHKGEVVGEAAWEPILDRDTWDQVKITLEQRKGAGPGSGTNTLRYWLRGVLICSRCRAHMVGWNGKGKIYWCSSLAAHGGCGRMSVLTYRAEETVEAYVLAYLRRPDVLRRLSDTTSSDATTRAREEIAAGEQQLKELATVWAKRQITMAEYLTARREVEEQMKPWRDVVTRSVPGTVRRLLKADNVKAAWHDLTPVDKRIVTQSVFPNGIEVLPPKKLGSTRS